MTFWVGDWVVIDNFCDTHVYRPFTFGLSIYILSAGPLFVWQRIFQVDDRAIGRFGADYFLRNESPKRFSGGGER